MNIINIKSKFKTAAVCVTSAAAGALIIAFPSETAASVKDGVNSCLEVIIPSLFAFTVLSVYLQKSGIYKIALKPVTVLLSLLMRIPEELAAVYVLSAIGGYPVGIKLLSSLVSEGRLSGKDASRMMCFCYGSGPSFFIGIAGLGVFGSAAIGIAIFAACFLSSLIVGTLVCRFGNEIRLKPKSSGMDLSGECFISSVTSGAKVMFTVCVMIVGFSAATCLLSVSGINAVMEKMFSFFGAGANSGAVFPAFLEVSRIRNIVPDKLFAAPLCAALLSFGGVCVIMQIAAIKEKSVSLKPFLISRLPVCLLSAVLALPICNMPLNSISAFSPNTAHGEAFSVNAGLSVCVLIMSGILMYTVEKGK